MLKKIIEIIKFIMSLFANNGNVIEGDGADVIIDQDFSWCNGVAPSVAARLGLIILGGGGCLVYVHVGTSRSRQ